MVAWHTDKFVTSGLVNIQENFREITLSLKKTSFYAGLKVKKVVYQNGGSYSYQTKRGFRKLHSIILKKKGL